MKSHTRTMFDLPRCWEQFDVHVSVTRDGHGTRSRQRLAARDVSDIDARQIHRHPLTRYRFSLRLAVHMKTANRDSATRRLQDQFIAVSQPPRQKRTGDDRPEPFQ
jgi:hypothetical protein